MEKYNIAGLERNTALIAAAFAGVLRSEGVPAMAIHNGPNVKAAAEEAAVAKFRAGPRLVAIGGRAAKAVTRAGQKLGTEEKSDLFGAVGKGKGAEGTKDMLAKTEDLLVQICRVEKKDPAQAKDRFEKVLVALAPDFERLV